MKIYLASRFERREELMPIMTRLLEYGHEITSSWMLNHVTDRPSEFRVKWAMEDVEDIRRSDALILLSGAGNISYPERGGRHFETGLAYGWGLRVFILGKAENIFHVIPAIRVHETLDTIIDDLVSLENYPKVKK